MQYLRAGCSTGGSTDSHEERLWRGHTGYLHSLTAARSLEYFVPPTCMVPALGFS